MAGFGRGWLQRFSQDDGAIDAVGFVAAEIAVGTGEVVLIRVEAGSGVSHELDGVAAGIALGFCGRNTGGGVERLVDLSDKVEKPD